ncbi:MAG: ATP-binding cassette domain-containing protein, partial [Candidatus Moraniibacteriota bacterium]
TSAAQKREWVVIGKAKKPRDNDKMGRGYRINRSAQKQGAMARSLEKRLTRLDTVAKPFERLPLAFELLLAKFAGKPVVRLSRVVLGYPDGFKTKAITLELPFTERVALLGMNGAGKSTLLKTLTGILPPLSGKITLAKGIIFGDLMQEHENISRKQTPIQYFAKELKVFERSDVLLLLAQFQFTPEFADTKIGDLSPGERVRFILATLVQKGSTVLVLDEPTNHLDLEAIEALEEALASYPGTLLLVTHDRTFLERMDVDSTYLLSEGKLSTVASYALYEKKLAPQINRLLKRLEERMGRR